MGPEDEGTPPDEHDGYLANDACSPSFLSTRQNHSGGNRARLYQEQDSTKETLRGRNAFKVAQRSDGDFLDLVKLLEENWFWRSSTASPSMADTSISRQSSPIRVSPQHQHRQHSSRLTSSNESPEKDEASKLAEGEARLQEGSRQRAGALKLDTRDLPSATDLSPPLTTKRSRSANIDDLRVSEQGENDLRPFSYAQGAAFKNRQKENMPDPDPTLGDPLGTWAQRVFRFRPDGRPSAPTHIPGTPDVSDLNPRQQRKPRNGRAPVTEERDDDEEDDAAAIEAAWRWRFNRRWRTEQAKQLDPAFGLDGEDEDGWDDALGYLDACGPGIHLQIARTISTDKNLASSMVSSGSDMSNLLMDESQKEKGALREQAEMDATKSIVSVAKKAQDLFKQQQKIERDVQTRWGNTKVSMSWAGHHLGAVKIDTYGHFPFILVKISDRTSAHRLLVRGRNNSSKADLMNAVTIEVKETCRVNNLATVSVALLGSGKMEWSRERDRRINISSCRMEKGCDPSIQTSDDVLRLASALTRASLPTAHRVTVNGEKLS